jgi:hypothetical protein
VARREFEQKLQEISQNSFGITYKRRSVAQEGAAVDLHIGTTTGINSSALEVACDPPPGIGQTNERVLSTDNARMELKSLANESCGADLHFPV